MGLSKTLYTKKNEGIRLTAAEERFCGIKKTIEKKLTKPKEKTSSSAESLLKDLLG